MKVLYHNDFDGECSAALVRMWADRLGTKMEATDFFRMGYDDLLDLDKIFDGEFVFIVDFSIPVETMRKLLQEKTKNVIWIDHHATSIEKYDACGEEFKEIAGVRSSMEAACVLTSWFLRLSHGFVEACVRREYDSSPDAEPRFVRLIGDRDVWRFAYEDTKDFYYGLWSEPTTPMSALWDGFRVTDALVERVIDAGCIVKRYRTKLSAEYVEKFAGIREWEGFKCCFMNVGLGSSEWFESTIHEDYDAQIPYCYCEKTKKWTVSMYAKKDGVSLRHIAQKHGGGGHDRACGFVCDKLPWSEQ